MTRGISIKARIGLTVAFLAGLLLATGGLGLVGTSRTNAAYRETTDNQMPGVTDIGNAEIFAARARMELDRASFVIGTPDAKPTAERARALYDTSESWWNRYLKFPQEAAEHLLAQDVAEKRRAYKVALDGFAAAIGASDEAGIADQAGLADHANRLQVTYGALAAADDALLKHVFERARQGFNQAQSAFFVLRIFTIAALCAGLAAAAGSYLTLRRAISRPLAQALDHFDSIAAGDLRRAVSVQLHTEMGQLLQGIAKMQRSLVETVQSVRGSSKSIATATREIAAGNTDLSLRTEEQASALQRTASSMDELTGTVRQNAENARQGSLLATNASRIASEGSAVVDQVVCTMGGINESSTKIADIIAIIEGIAFQTNILALNAAVEAARAGEDGRGFAVVAGEVRSLAQRSSAAAREIKELIDTSVERVQSGSALVNQAGRTMTEIIGAVRRVTNIMEEIAAACEDQRRGIEQVALAVTQMDGVTQQNAALVEEAAAAALSLDQQASKLNQAVSVFSVDASLSI
ncbi:methyl-accepting chemotaxis protein [Paraburkholderia sp. 2C]